VGTKLMMIINKLLISHTKKNSYLV